MLRRGTETDVLVHGGGAAPWTSSRLPVCSQNCLYILWPLRDGLIPGQPGLRAEGSHRLNELLHLRIEQLLAVAGLNGFGLIGTAAIPILNGRVIGRAMNRKPQIVDLPTQDEVEWIDRRAKQQRIGIPGRTLDVGDLVLTVTAMEELRIVPRAALEDIVAEAAGQRVMAASAIHGICAGVTRQDVI